MPSDGSCAPVIMAEGVHVQQDVQLSLCTLRLSPWQVEQEFWNSVRLLKALDAVGLCSSVSINVMLMRKFGLGHDRPDWIWHFLPVLVYLTAGILQLATLLAAPALHQRNRFAVNTANRLVRLASVTWAVWNMSAGSVVADFTATLNSGLGSGSGDGGGGGASLRVMRTLASLPVLWVSHAVNYLLPYWVVAPLQLVTLAVTMMMMRPIVCALAGQPAHILRAAAHACQMLRSTMHLATMLAVPASLPMPGDDHNRQDVSGSTKDLLLLVLFTFTMVLLVVPCVVAYFVELSWKLGFVKAKRLRIAQHDNLLLEGSAQAGFLMSYIVYVAVCTVWLACDAAVSALPPISCQCGS